MAETAIANESNTAVAKRVIGSGVRIAKRGPVIDSLPKAFEVAKLMSQSSFAVPPHCRDQHGVCFGILIQAMAWEFEPYAVAGKSYVTGEGDKAKLAYESQLIHAVIEKWAPIKERLNYEILGTGDERRCRVWATFKGESEPRSFTSEPLKEFTKTVTKQGRNGPYQVGPKSPLWHTKPEVQLFYNASRDWARIYCPDVIMGVYTPDELEDAATASEAARLIEAPPERPTRPDVTATLDAFGAPARKAAEEATHIDHDEDGVVIEDESQDKVETLADAIKRLMNLAAKNPPKTPEVFEVLVRAVMNAATTADDADLLLKWWKGKAVAQMRSVAGVEVAAVPAMTATIEEHAARLQLDQFPGDTPP